MRHSSVQGEGSSAQADDGISGGRPAASGSVPPPRNGSGRRRRGGSGSGGGKRSTRRGKRRVLRWVASVVALLILGTAAAGYLYYRHLNGNIQSGQRLSGDSGVARTEADAAGRRPINILMLGSDIRDEANAKLGGGWDNIGGPARADVQMLIHISADRKNASVTSVPRDTMVDIPECTDPKTGDKYKATKTMINESLARGGPGCTLATWEKMTNVYIDHWMMIDFTGVVSMADAIGGVDVCVNQNVFDQSKPGSGTGGSGLKLKAGTTKVQGEQALQWLRTRHSFGSDMGRAKAQHMYMNSMMRGLKSQNAFTDIPRLTGLAEAATKSLKVSEEIGSVKKLLDLGLALKDVPINRITMATIPVMDYPGDKNRVALNPADAEKMWTMLRKDVAMDSNGDPAESGKPGTSASPSPSPEPSKAPATDPAKIAVHVVNGTGVGSAPAPRRATVVAGQLVTKGFALAKADSTLTPEKTTVVRYAADAQAAEAQSVAAALGIPASSVQKAAGADRITLVVGADWREGNVYPQQAAPDAGAVPESAEILNGTDTSCMDIYEPFRW
ncbi:LCP family protein [Streptomyces sp. NBC_00503]|uniref:LCP family protein n=1 Tax=Streptomyces sp. NBC_00503 TaxID=2903659 RepID=UPI002E7FD307|nr:LCP family protein [Streptomyces sp. NBC_00503]WUD81630.1 LCP family protein [Streptomyces sp. NBC_00503]